MTTSAPTTLRAMARGLTVIVALSACGDSTSPGDGPPPPPPPVSSLVGVWTGTVDGLEYGHGSLVMTLRADSTFHVQSDNTNYCPVDQGATWRVTGPQFTATGRDCNNITVNFTASISEKLLNGTWSATSGKVGTFRVGR